jgi:NAD(P)-dependent dehydrogenase (short-subunit alcohol dehydrogenase family)
MVLTKNIREKAGIRSGDKMALISWEKDERLPGTIHRTAEEIEKQGGRALPLKCDVTSEESVQAMVDAALKEFGKVDILVNNAGVAFYYPVVEAPIQQMADRSGC